MSTCRSEARRCAGVRRVDVSVRGMSADGVSVCQCEACRRVSVKMCRCEVCRCVDVTL